VKRGRIVQWLCCGVTLSVLCGLSASSIGRAHELLQTGGDGKRYPSAVYGVMPVPGTSKTAGRGATGADFSQVYTSARSLLAGHSAYLTPSGRTTDVFGRPAGYPPLMNWIYVPLATLSYVDALLAHTVFWAAAFLLVSGLFLQRMGLIRHWFALSVMCASLYCLTPIGYTHLERGQFDLVVATAAVLAMMCVVLPRNHYLLAGVAGLMGALKWTAVSYLGCFAALAFFVSANMRRLQFVLIPGVMALGTFSFWEAVLEYWPTIQKYEIEATPNGVTFEWFLPRSVVKLLPVVLTLAVALLIWLRGRDENDRRQLLLAVIAPFSVALMCTAICYGTLSYEYHTIVMLGMLPGVIVWLERAPLILQRHRLTVVISLGMFIPFAYRVFGFGESFQPQTITGLYALLATVMFYVCCSIIVRASPALVHASEVPAAERLVPPVSSPHCRDTAKNELMAHRHNLQTDARNVSMNGWALSSLYAVCAAVLLTNLASFRPPEAHRFVDLLPPGAADLIPTINAASALLDGENPYRISKLSVPDPYFYSRGENEGITYLYPPSHALLYVPLTWLARGNFFDAVRMQFVVSLICIAVLAWQMVRLLRSTTRLDAVLISSLMPVLGLVLGLNVGNQLGVERGQSDLITSVFAWSAVSSFCQRRLAMAAFLAVSATLLKGYGLLLAPGLLALAALENWRRTLLGASLALGCLLLPVVHYLPDAAQAYGIRSAMFWSGWTNQGFSNLAFSLGLPRDGGRFALTGIAVLSAAAAWIRLFRDRYLDDDQTRSFWAIAFATASLTAVVGYSLNSISYAAVVVMPGALALVLAQDHFFPGISGWRRSLLGSLLTAVSAGLFLFDFGEVAGLRPRWLHTPLAAAGEFILVVVIAVSAQSALRQRQSAHAGAGKG
jgi:hypothetical protein